MSGTPKLKIYDAGGTYQASVKEYEAAAALVSFYGPGATVRSGHQKRWTLWTEGEDGEAYESYDAAAQTMIERQRELGEG